MPKLQQLQLNLFDYFFNDVNALLDNTMEWEQRIENILAVVLEFNARIENLYRSGILCSVRIRCSTA
ncbi:hypothetical protein C6H64_00885 [Photorhabdus luminescens]|nr:hypothetical protein C6H64_00885 [Photorhabdus luminescens]PQQ35483.1 hypothetical protein C6H69_01050 [Photorhabdus luminescens]